MESHQEAMEQLQDIRNIMERSSRFISLSGLSGIGAGIIAICGAGYAAYLLSCPVFSPCRIDAVITSGGEELMKSLLHTAFLTFFAACIVAFLFTFSRSRKVEQSLSGPVSSKLFWAMAIPILIGGIFIFRLIHQGVFGMVSPGSLLFYGLALVNTSRYTVREVRNLGYAVLITGVINLLVPDYSILLWMTGFGLLHIIYGAAMWWKYER